MVDVSVLKGIYDQVNSNKNLVGGRDPEGTLAYLDTAMTLELRKVQPDLSNKDSAEAVQTFLREHAVALDLA